MNQASDPGCTHALGESDEVLVVGVHVGDLDVDEQHELVLGLLLLFAHARVDDALRLLAQRRVPRHLVGGTNGDAVNTALPL